MFQPIIGAKNLFQNLQCTVISQTTTKEEKLCLIHPISQLLHQRLIILIVLVILRFRKNKSGIIGQISRNTAMKVKDSMGTLLF